jgi:WD40 repeat protein
MKQIRYRIILAMFILSGKLLLCGSVVPDRDNKSIVSIHQKDRSTIITKICREFRHRIAKQSPADLYQLPNAILASIIDFAGKKWNLWSTKQLRGIHGMIAPYRNNSILIAQKYSMQIVDFADIDAHGNECPYREISQVGPVVVLPDGRVAAALIVFESWKHLSSKDRYKIDIWNVGSNVVEQQLEGHFNRVRALVVLPGNRLASGSDDATIIIWNLSFGAPIILRWTGFYSSSSLLAMPDNVLIIGRDEDYQPILLLDCVTGDIVDSVNVDDGGVSCLTKLSDTLFASGTYRQFISGAYSSPIKIWSKEREKRVSFVSSLRGHTDVITALIALSKDQLVSASQDETIRIWNYNTGHCLSILNNYTDTIHSLTPISNGAFVSISGDKTLMIWKKQMDCAYHEPFQKRKLKLSYNFLSIAMKYLGCGIQ